MNEIRIRKSKPQDIHKIWKIFREVIRTGDTYVFPPKMKKKEALENWVGKKYFTYVAEIDGKILGTYILKANQMGLGSHVANGSYMVHPAAQGKGLGKAMGAHSIAEAKRMGFKAMQFNFVVSTNVGAVKLWQQLGFKILGTIPNAFNHQKLGYVDVYVMHLLLN